MLNDVYSRENLDRILKRVRNVRDGESLVEALVRRAVLTEFQEELSASIAHDVATGTWKPEPAYVCTVSKGACGFRELCFPGTIDSIVARAAIDSIEEEITCDDNGRAFCGRSHASTNREPGDYEKWFEVWQDYSAAISEACEAAGYAFVYTTDVTDFFPSVAREAAKKELARRTSATPALLELLFYTLETWLPRVSFAAMSGLPIDDVDVSRLIAHNFLKQVDQSVASTDYQYLRYVDDAVFIVKTREDAEKAARFQHQALRAIGLNPSAAKSESITTDEYQSRRHRDVNLRLARVARENNVVELLTVAREWHERDPAATEAWERVCVRLYAIAIKLKCWQLNEFILGDLRQATDARLVRTLFRFLRNHPFEHELSELQGIMRTCNRRRYGAEHAIYSAEFLADGMLSADWSESIADLAFGNISDTSFDAPGRGFSKALFVLAGHKHGGKAFRDRLQELVEQDPVKVASDQHFRASYVFVMACWGQLPDRHRRLLMTDASRDTHMALRLADAARQGELQAHRSLLRMMPTKTQSGWTLSSRYLPLLWAGAIAGQGRVAFEAQADRWVSGDRRIVDEVARRHVEECRSRYTR